MSTEPASAGKPVVVYGAPGIAQMYTTGEIAACLCLETPSFWACCAASAWSWSRT